MTVLPDHEAREGLFTASLAHELKTPLAALQAASSNLRRNLESLVKPLLFRDAATAREMEALAPILDAALRSPGSGGVGTGLLPQGRLRAVASRLLQAGMKGDADAAAHAIVRGSWEEHLDQLVPILVRADAGAVIEILETVSKLRSSLRSADAAVARIAGIVTALREGPGAAPPAPSAFDLRACIGDALATLRHAVPPLARVEVRCEAGVAVSGDAGRFGQVLTNLIGNALSALPPEGGEVIVEVERDGAMAAVRIVDSGPGIPEAVRSAIFSPFFTTKTAEKGTGLGLFIAREIVEGMGGSLRFESRPGRTCFEARVPAAPPKDGGA